MQKSAGFHTLTVLVAPLDWGMGHASRCIPIINQLLANNCRVWLAGEGDTLRLLQEEFPYLPTVALPGYRVHYQQDGGHFSRNLFRQLPTLLAAVRNERRWLKRFLEKCPVDIVISDNRFGLYTSKAATVFITHQLSIRTGLGKWMDTIVRSINYRFIKRFDTCWIPDYANRDSLAGELSHPPSVPGNCRYIGALSRLEKKRSDKRYDLLIVLSGPEPTRTAFENKLLENLAAYQGKALLVRGTTLRAPIPAVSNIEVADLLTTTALNEALNAADMVICRSGYTSVMDLIKLAKKAVLVPTPGQPEQEYLARRLHEHKIFYSVTEKNFRLDHVMSEAMLFPYRLEQNIPELYKQCVDDLLNNAYKKLQ